MSSTGAASVPGHDAKNDNYRWEDAYRDSREMHGFSIPPRAYQSCACGHMWRGPAHVVMDQRGFFWNCPGCEGRFRTPAEEGGAPTDTGNPSRKANGRAPTLKDLASPGGVQSNPLLARSSVVMPQWAGLDP